MYVYIFFLAFFGGTLSNKLQSSLMTKWLLFSVSLPSLPSHIMSNSSFRFWYLTIFTSSLCQWTALCLQPCVLVCVSGLFLQHRWTSVCACLSPALSIRQTQHSQWQCDVTLYFSLAFFHFILAPSTVFSVLWLLVLIMWRQKGLSVSLHRHHMQPGCQWCHPPAVTHRALSHFSLSLPLSLSVLSITNIWENYSNSFTDSVLFWPHMSSACPPKRVFRRYS